jgi:hypothetical protein
MKQHLRSAFITTALRVRSHRPEDAILLSCDPRSGSTWISEVLTAATPSAVIWEPFHRDNVPAVQKLGFAWRQCIPAGAEWPEAERLIRKIMSGGVINQWTSWANPAVDFVRAEQLIIKCCRANGFLPWMIRKIDFKRKPIHFLRHPFAIAASQIKMGNFDTAGMDRDLDRGPFTQEMNETSRYIRGLTTNEEKIVAMWCRTHLAALKDPLTHERTIRVHYENLTINPDTEIKRVFGGWGESVPDNVLSIVHKASRMTEKSSRLETPEQQIFKWRRHFDDKQISRMAAILKDFEINIYDENAMPIAKIE